MVACTTSGEWRLEGRGRSLPLEGSLRDGVLGTAIRLEHSSKEPNE